MRESILYPFASSTRQVQDLCGLWKFWADWENKEEKKDFSEGLLRYELMPVPACYNELYTEKYKKEYAGDVWYSTDFFIPEEWREKDVVLRFGGVGHTAEIFVNGISMGIHTGGFLPFECIINDAVIFGEKSCLVVRANNELSEISLPVGKTEENNNGRKRVIPNFDFFHYAGIHRPVKLMALPRDRIEDINIQTSFEILEGRTCGYVDYEIISLGKNSQMEIRIYNCEDKMVSFCCGKRGRAVIEDAKLWEIHQGNLYRFQVRMLNEKHRCVDEYEQMIGVRTVEIKNQKLLLNNKEIYLKGFGRHEDAPFSGRAYNSVVQKKDFELMKWCGANSFRTSHYPYSEEVLQMADKEGFLVIGETAAVGMQDFDGNWLDPSCDSSGRYFGNQEVRLQGRENHVKHIEHMIARDKNHPCIIMWSLMNEPDCSDTGAEDYYNTVFKTAKKADPQKRPGSFTIHTSVGRDCIYWDLCDVVMLNKYNGWYFEAGIDIDCAMRHLQDELELWRETGKPVLISEFGADAITGMHELPAVQWSEEYQMEFLKKTMEVFRKFEFIVGEHIWNLADFQTAEALHRINGNRKGIFTRDRKPKMAAFFVKNNWKDM